MAQDKPELLAGTSNFPRTDADGGNRRPAVVAPAPDSTLNRGDNILTGVATRSVAQLAESSRAVAPLLKGFDTELKAIRTALKPNKGILKSLLATMIIGVRICHADILQIIQVMSRTESPGRNC